ncbi:dihydroorotate dehydrogenase [Nonomuraea turkmeniaca]|uniref:dihydroorotate dehydrogenase n=1 Tax=Nonomuraea turkmeniaca TaxID=103838 RepID=UPI001B877629|nr:dihydroorotate dehydrogenase [Nonomuraea turkmeniaca]
MNEDHGSVVVQGVDLGVTVGELRLDNPIMPASGCFGPELSELIPAHRLGAVVTKTIFSGQRAGNRAPRLTESANGMLNSVGIPSIGVHRFRREVLPRYQRIGVPVIVSIGGLRPSEYWEVAEELPPAEYAALEVNVSCPNLDTDGSQLGVDPESVARVTEGVVARTDRPVIVKLTPNVTSIAELASAAAAGGASAVTVANTVKAIAIDWSTRRPVLGHNFGGLSGAAIKPLALRLVWEAAQGTHLPVIGCGGVTRASDVVEFLLAGASAVQVGTATFTRPDTMIRILDELGPLARDLDVGRVSEFTRGLLMNE